MIHDYSNSVWKQISGHTVPCMIQRVIIAQVKDNNDGWKTKDTLILHDTQQEFAWYILFYYLELLCSMWMQHIWIFPDLLCPTCREREICDRDPTIWMTVKVIHKTHNCKLKGTPRTSNLSISKSTPIVALYVLSNVSLQNLEDRNINKCNHSSFFFFTHMVGMYVKILFFSVKAQWALKWE